MKTVFSNNCKVSDYSPILKVKDKWLVCFNKIDMLETTYVLKNGKYAIEKIPTGMCAFDYIVFSSKPSIASIRKEFEEIIDNETTNKIVKEFEYEGKRINLSKDNQLNYKRAYDLAMQTNGLSLPFTIKCYDGSNTCYLVFDDTVNFTKFYVALSKHVDGCLQEGWKKKDSIDYDAYK